MQVRPAALADAAAISEVVIASITELCVGDHRGDPEILGRWLARKSPDDVARWIGSTDILLVAEESGAVLGAGAAWRSGEITLNYVSPKARFRGVSSAMLAALEGATRRVGAESFTLESTGTAHSFYLARDYSDAGPSSGKHGLVSFPMRKPAS